MARKSGRSLIVVERSTGFSTSEPELPLVVTMTHAHFPGWWFSIAVTPAGTPAGLQVSSPAPSLDLSADFFAQDRSKRTTAMREWRIDPGTATPITTRQVRQIPLGDLQAVALEHWRQDSGFMRQAIERGVPMEAFGEAMMQRPGRRGRSDHEYAQIAALYVEAVGSGESLRDLAGRLHVSPSTLTNQVHQARRRGLLTSTTKGRSGGELTQLARDLLNKGS